MKTEIKVGTQTFKTQKELENYTRSLLREMGPTNSVKLKKDEYFNFLILLIQRHPHCDEKLEKFVDLHICYDSMNKQALALNIINNDNSLTEISWRVCVSGKGKCVKTNFAQALRYYILSQIFDFKNSSDLSYCRLCQSSLLEKKIHIDHYVKQFSEIVQNFIDINKEIIIPTMYDKENLTFRIIFKDKDAWIGKLFEKYHYKYSTLRVLCETCNLTRGKYNSIN
jgi:hypothetical protein